MTQPIATETTRAERGQSQGQKFLTFALGAEEYGLEILKVQEIVGILPITRIPRTPSFVRGVVNLRGKVVPVMDLRERLGMSRENARDLCIVFVKVHGLLLGIVVDGVSEVVTIPEKDVAPPPQFGVGVHVDYLLGVANNGSRVRLLLDLDRALGREELEGIAPGSHAA
jgi:purine-binding chemotaxis protein CheW